MDRPYFRSGLVATVRWVPNVDARECPLWGSLVSPLKPALVEKERLPKRANRDLQQLADTRGLFPGNDQQNAVSVLLLRTSS